MPKSSKHIKRRGKGRGRVLVQHIPVLAYDGKHRTKQIKHQA